jgi:hypothetical protein
VRLHGGPSFRVRVGREKRASCPAPARGRERPESAGDVKVADGPGRVEDKGRRSSELGFHVQWHLIRGSGRVGDVSAGETESKGTALASRGNWVLPGAQLFKMMAALS